MFTNGKTWVDRGAEHFKQKRNEPDLLSLKRRASALGFQLVQQAASI
jgi:hypothetical protein